MSTAANRSHSILRRLWHRFGGQQGFVLPVTIGMCTMLTMAGTTVVAYSTSSARTSSRSSADQSAYALAEAGVNNAMSVLSEPSNNALDPYLLPARTTPYAGGTVTYSGTLDESTATWTITATGLMRNPTGPGTSPVRRVLTVRVPVQPSFQQPLNNMAWNYIWAKATGSPCDMTIGQSVKRRDAALRRGQPLPPEHGDHLERAAGREGRADAFPEGQRRRPGERPGQRGSHRRLVPVLEQGDEPSL